MRIVEVASAARFWPFLGGQIAWLKQRGWEVHLISSGGPALGALARDAGVSAWEVALSRAITPWQDLRALVEIWTLLRRLRPDVVHAHTLKAGVLGMLGAWAARVPARVYTLHGLVWQTRRGWGKLLLQNLDRVACRLAGCVLAVSPSVRRAAIEERLAPAEKILVAGGGSADGLDLNRFDPARLDAGARRSLRQRYGIPPEAPVIGFVGRLVPDKGIAELAALWRILRDQFPTLHLVVAGETEAHDPLPAGIEAGLRTDPRVRLAGWVEEMPEHYAIMDVCLLPSRREGLPYAAIEAAAMERAVAGFAVAGVVDAVEDGVTGLLVKPGEVAGLAAAVAGLVRDPERAARMGRQARLRCRRLYGAGPVRRVIHEQYLRLLALPPSPPWWKRPLDAMLAALLLGTLAPLGLVVALAVWIGLGRPILYRQRRPGKGERPFDLLKFRTMKTAPEGAPDRVRLTRLGRWLRRLSLDELPQLVNILRGQMSFIGPRPLLERYLPFYTLQEQQRHRVRPGLSGWAQVNGRNDLDWSRRLEMDVWYVHHMSFRLDARIALSTVWQVLARRGVKDDPAATMADLDQERQSQERQRMSA